MICTGIDHYLNTLSTIKKKKVCRSLYLDTKVSPKELVRT